MPYTVASSFERFHDNINLGGEHRDTANRRRDDIVAKLNKSFEIIDSFSTGSIPKYTALKSHADLDVIVVLDWHKHIQGKRPASLLQDVSKCLVGWRTGGRKNGQAVTLYYTTWPNADIVPVSRVLYADGTLSHYLVPDSNTGTWIKSNPKKHAANVEAKSIVCGENFRRIIKIIKHWNSIHGGYLQSYHIEVLAINVLNGQLNDISLNLYNFFDKSLKLLQTPLWYDNGFADNYLNGTIRPEVCKRFTSAASKSLSAWYCTYSNINDQKPAIEIWRQLFGEKFPAYG